MCCHSYLQGGGMMKPNANTHKYAHARTHARTHAHTHARTHTRTHARTYTNKQTNTHRPSVGRRARQEYINAYNNTYFFTRSIVLKLFSNTPHRMHATYQKVFYTTRTKTRLHRRLCQFPIFIVANSRRKMLRGIC